MRCKKKNETLSRNTQFPLEKKLSAKHEFGFSYIRYLISGKNIVSLIIYSVAIMVHSHEKYMGQYYAFNRRKTIKTSLIVKMFNKIYLTEARKCSGNIKHLIFILL